LSRILRRHRRHDLCIFKHVLQHVSLLGGDDPGDGSRAEQRSRVGRVEKRQGRPMASHGTEMR
jgi:hypothetical protein